MRKRGTSLIKNVKKKVFDFVMDNLDFITFTKVWTFYQKMFQSDGKKINNIYQSHVVSCKSKGKKFWVVRMSYPLMGIGAAMRNFILMASWVEKKGWIPLLDYEYYETFLNGSIGVDNIQEYMFKSEFHIPQIMENNYVIVSTINHVDVYDKYDPFIVSNVKSAYCKPRKEYFEQYYKQFGDYLDKYFCLKEELVEQLRQDYSVIFDKDKVVMAVMLKEEFSKEGRVAAKDTCMEKIYEKHPLSISVEESIELVQEYMCKWNCDYVFVSSMMKETREIYSQVLGDKVLFVNRKLYSWEDERSNFVNLDIKYKNDIKKNFPLDECVDRNCAYLKEIYLASQCDYLLGAPATGTTLALAYKKGGYNDILLFEDYNGVQVEI